MIKKTLRKSFKFILWTLLIITGTSIGAVVLFRFVEVPCSPLMLIRCCEQMSRGESTHLHNEWVDLDDMSKYMPVAVIASEDQNFMKHNGFDMNAIQGILKKQYDESGWDGIKKGNMRGGSTISQQTAKNLFLWPESSWLRKGLETYFTILIEALWSKKRIMEVYLNIIEMGDGIYGVEAVAHDNFGCSAGELTRAQCALIAATLPNPLKFDSKHPSRYMYKRQAWIQRQMKHIPLFAQ